MNRAVQYRSFGDPSVLEDRLLPDEAPREGEVKILTIAVGVNPFDYKVRRGWIPTVAVDGWHGVGSDFSGVVTEVGDGSCYFTGEPIRVGDPVLGWTSRGALQQQLIVPAYQVAPKPAEVDWSSAAAMIRPVITAQAAIRVLQPRTGDTVLVSAASGAVGSLFSQLAVREGAIVIGTASEARHAEVRDIGAIPVAYGEGILDRVCAAAPGGVTHVQDNFGGGTVQLGVALGVPPSRICTVVDYAAAADLGVRMPDAYDRTAARLAESARQFANGQLRLTIAREFTMDRARQAFTLLESGHPGGKIIILPQAFSG